MIYKPSVVDLDVGFSMLVFLSPGVTVCSFVMTCLAVLLFIINSEHELIYSITKEVSASEVVTIQRPSDFSITEFQHKWDGKWPVMIKGLVTEWEVGNWTREFLHRLYSQEDVLVTEYKSVGGLQGGLMTLSEFYRQLSNGEYSNNHWIYLNDEHFISKHPKLLNGLVSKAVYTDADYFALFPKQIRPKDSLLLWGSAHSRSQLHVDPYNWTGTLALISGTKYWKLIHPGLTSDLGLVRQRLGFPLECAQLVSPLDLFSTGVSVTGKLGDILKVEQKPGDLLFIPSGWAHQAYNSEETIAVSSQYLNNYNYQSVMQEIAQCHNLPHKNGWDTDVPAQQVESLLRQLSSVPD